MVGNEQVARILSEIADLMEVGDENSFKVRSYRRAVEMIEGLGQDLAAVHAAGELETLPGIGKSLAAQIAQYVVTGQIEHHRELLAKYPHSLLDMLAIPGLGPKTAGLIYRELGIDSVDALERAAQAQRLRDLKGMGAKSEERILKAIAVYRQDQGRSLLCVALPLARGLRDRLLARDDVLAAEMAGSVRRGRETIGDLDLLATSEHPATVCRDFAEGKEVIVAGDTKVSVRVGPGDLAAPDPALHGGETGEPLFRRWTSAMNVDLRVVPQESYGAALMYFTGSKQHNVEVRERARQIGLTLNEYGLYEDTGDGPGARVAGETEEEIYRALDLPWIPPELREARGEIAAAEAGTLPNLLTEQDITCDLHLHTVGSDGMRTVEEMAEACLAAGYTHMGITDHSPALTVASGQSREQILRQVEQIRELNARLAAEGHRFTVLAGIEADILAGGNLDLPQGVFEQLDFVIGAVHQGFSTDADHMTGRIVAALASGRVDILAHPTGRLLLGRAPYGIHIETVIEAALEHNVALEVNASPERLDLNDAHCRLARQRGALLSINTDAHDTPHLQFVRYGVLTARRGWVEAAGVINTWSKEELSSWLSSRR